MSEKRLEEIKNTKYIFLETSKTDLKSDLEYLIEQAELVKELEEEKEFFRDYLVKVKASENITKKKNKRYRETIEKAKEIIWETETDSTLRLQKLHVLTDNVLEEE